MTIKDIFINRQFQPRNGWRMGLYLILFILISVPAIVASQIIFKLSDFSGITKETITLMISAASGLAAAFLLLKFLDRRDIRSLGMGFRPGAIGEFSWGLLIGFVMLCLAVLLPYAFGFYDIRFSLHDTETIIWGLTGNLMLYLMVGFNEEIMFRGYLFQSLTEGIGKIPATLVFSVVFGLAHAGNPNVSVFGVINIILAGILLSAAYLQTRSLWLPIGIHTAWNFTQGFIWGLPVSGTTPRTPLVLSMETGPDWITGGTFGPEGGAVCTFFCILATLAVWFFFKPVNEMRIITNEALRTQPFKPLEAAEVTEVQNEIRPDAENIN